MYIGRHNAFRHAVTPEKRSRLLTLLLPRGPIDVHLRLTRYANGSPALELQDAFGASFYAPTIAVAPAIVAEAAPPELADAGLLAIKPSALRNGIANALVDAGFLIDIGVEVPADRTWARLMQIAPGLFETAEEEAAAAVALALHPLPVPRAWEKVVQRIRHAFHRQGMEIDEQDAMLAWAWHSRALQKNPSAPPPAGVEIVALLQPYFSER